MKNQNIRFAIVATVSIALIAIVSINRISAQNALKNIENIELHNGLLAKPVAKNGKQYLIPEKAIYRFSTEGGEVEEINNPKFISVNAADAYISDVLPGISVELEGEQYFFPYQILNWHQVVNLTLGEKKYAITFDPLCYAQSVLEDQHFTHSNTVFGNGALLLDESGDTWSQLKSTKVIGSNLQNETNITEVPNESILWNEWKKAYPEGKVLSSETGFDYDYTRHPYGAYDTSEIVYFPSIKTDDRIGKKWIVDVLTGTNAIAFSRTIEQGMGINNTELEGRNVAVFYDPTQKLNRAFDANVEDQTLTFAYNFETKTWKDEQTESTWNANGEATAGELTGTKLQPIALKQMMWHCAAPAYSNLQISRVETLETEASEVDVIIE